MEPSNQPVKQRWADGHPGPVSDGGPGGQPWVPHGPWAGLGAEVVGGGGAGGFSEHQSRENGCFGKMARV